MGIEGGFKAMGLSAELLKALEDKGFEEPTPIQEKIIPLFMSGQKDIIGQAQTGTGKTAAFGIPILERLQRSGEKPRALVLTPTRELALQVSEELISIGSSKRLRVVPVYGGQAIGPQIRRLREGVDLVVGTPGRVIDHIERKTMDLSAIEFLVLDEADEMLDMGFAEDVERILASVSPARRSLLFSATMPERILAMARRFMGDYLHVSVESPAMTASLTEQLYFEVREGDKFEALCRIIDLEDDFFGLVFCRTKVLTTELSARLAARGYHAEALSGDVSQQQREEILGKFRERRLSILCATDVAARGIDIDNLSHVINFSLPQNPEAYVHRVGRTGRAGKEGMAITFVTPDEYRKLMYIRHSTKAEIRRERLPAIDAVIASQREKLRRGVEESLSGAEVSSEIDTLAGELLSRHDPAALVRALLQREYGKRLDRSRYREIRELASPDASGTARIFLRLGLRDGYDKAAVIAFLIKTGGMDKRKIGNVRVFDSFSLIQVALVDGEALIRNLSHGRNRNLARFDRGPQQGAGPHPGTGPHPGQGRKPGHGAKQSGPSKRPERDNEA